MDIQISVFAKLTSDEIPPFNVDVIGYNPAWVKYDNKDGTRLCRLHKTTNQEWWDTIPQIGYHGAICRSEIPTVWCHKPMLIGSDGKLIMSHAECCCYKPNNDTLSIDKYSKYDNLDEPEIIN